jgi:dolichyl-phosphate-mannose--protein O-mannosyl transferase
MTDTEWQNEVSGYGFPGFEGDANDFFRVEIVRSESKKGVAHERLRYRHPNPRTMFTSGPSIPSSDWSMS